MQDTGLVCGVVVVVHIHIVVVI